MSNLQAVNRRNKSIRTSTGGMDDASAGVVRAASERRSRASCARLPHVPHAGAVAPDVYWLTPVQRSGRRNPVTDPQLLTLTMAIVIPLSLLLYSNSKITECKET